MKKLEIKNKNNETVSNVFYFLEYENRKYKNKQEFINYLVRTIPKIKGIGYAGFKDEANLHKHLVKAVFGFEKFNGVPKIDFGEQEIFRIIKNTLEKCNEKLKSKVVYFFIFPNFNKFKKEKMNGVGGLCPWKNTILININPVSGWQDALRRSLCHEFHHSIIATKRNPQTWTLLEALVYEGMADNFVEDITGKTSPWVKALSKKESMVFLKKIENLLDLKDEQIYQEIFFEKNKKYPMWAGYAAGYQMVKAYFKAHPDLTWSEISELKLKIFKAVFFS
ncbi:MAG TPA: DUF2268 domain-containing putative Zn-dependent protease [Candidatus Moranbacteria bacterium]|nr:DUF2268 domain-containing putative Zn-dependent protease [Candidatus Moranbacteria bacterium]HSA08438.1 DUF2268 domain-containing putative Zn-dependent protease [Candidatus Moranbacteria bacterium]